MTRRDVEKTDSAVFCSYSVSTQSRGMSCDVNSYAVRDSNDVIDTVRYRRAEILRGAVASIDSNVSFSGELSCVFTVFVLPRVERDGINEFAGSSFR